jgi:tetratricopeptide (TPR) repeat protein
MPTVRLLLAVSLLALASRAGAQPTPDRQAPLLDGIGPLHFPITTNNPLAQRYFDQALTLAYAFNHAEAKRSFEEAARLDPNCAICYWGIALVLGPNINAPMDPAASPEAYTNVQRAREKAGLASERERAYIEALAARYTAEAPADRAALDAAYKEAMRTVAARYPDDLDAATLYAESMMDTTPWNYWENDGAPGPITGEILATLERVLKHMPDHPGANHLYIHAVEKARPELGERSADRLRQLVPVAGHLVHMPAHIYIRIGRYTDAAEANRLAIEADNSYVAQCQAQGIYPLAYLPHNHHFLWAATTLEGKSAEALAASRGLVGHTDHTLMHEPAWGTLQHYYVTPMLALVRFGRWDEILAEPMPSDDLPYPRAVWAYGHAMAHLRQGRPDDAATSLDVLRSYSAHPSVQDVAAWGLNGAGSILAIAEQIVLGELAAARGEYALAVEHLEKGVALEDALVYNEPADWHQPVRQILGAVLMEAGSFADAERVYRDDLERYPRNGWSLFGLHASLKAQGRDADASLVRLQFERAWAEADITLTASRY